ncbi:amidohydrolase family protein [Pantoea sp. Acro-805]|uniref:Amidohydrolase family protein n=1 Tax=Candidatus Pantoea formicae TaxID=2608355 RepID=A0ABX0QTK9_9GAMM|nr:amidohydrolase family protein [Erwiniaceae bacterium L1_54_3]NIF00099.1 amidohydrolase family protein [Pantoea formicae]
MRIDAHQHLWRYRAKDYPWMSSEMGRLQRDYLPEDLSLLLDRQQLQGSITVQARQCDEETTQLLQWATESEGEHAVVGWIDITASDLPARLNAVQHPLLRGFRHQVQDERDPAAWLQQPSVSAGIALLQQQHYVWDMLVTWRHLPALTAFAAQHDHHWLVLDHLGKPDISQGAQAWGAQIAELAAMPHVVCKLSGLVTEVPQGQWQAEQLRPFIEEALARFGPQRLMFGSDWPVCLLAAEYHEVAQLTHQAIEMLSPDEQANIWGNTAAQVYQLLGEKHESVFTG